MKDLIEETLDFLECSIHTILYIRKIYPSVLFEQRRYQNITVWQSRHPEINAYVRRVLENAKPLISQGVVDRIIIATSTSTSEPIDHITLKCQIFNNSNSINNQVSYDNNMQVLQEELRSTVLRIGLLDAQLPKLPEDCLWNILVITTAGRSDTTLESDGCLQAALSSGEWYIDNNMSTEQQELVQRVGSMSQSSSILPSLNNSTSSGANSSSSSREVSESSPRLIPVKSFQNTLLNMSVYVHVFK